MAVRVDVQREWDVSDPNAFDVYLNGEHSGGLQAVLTPLNSLNNQAQAMARVTAARVAAQAEAARVAAVQAASDVQAQSQQTLNAGTAAIQ
jgi:hypothetical protein